MDVKRGPILFRCDATVESGFEPFYQCLSLAAAMQRRRRGTHFFSYLDPLSLAHVINRGNNEWNAAESKIGGPGDLEATLREVRRLDASCVVVNGSTVTTEYLEALNATGTRVISIDSEAGIHFPSKIVVNPYLTPNAKPYKYDHGTQLLLGQKYALVRGIFRRQRTIRATEQPGPFRAMVCFGDDDHAEQSLLRTKQLLEMPKVDKVSIVTRSHNSMYDELKEFAASSRGKVEIITEVKELMTRLVRVHFALTSGDTWAMELCCVGIPQLMMPTTTTHLMNAKRLDEAGAGTLLGAAEDISFDSLQEAVSLVLDDPMERMGMNRCGRRLIDGRGGDRIVNGMEIVLHTPLAQDQQVRRAA
jgi:spore coat polysaccharide biosynthesis predicted glycosyltransferase SpsG